MFRTASWKASCERGLAAPPPSRAAERDDIIRDDERHMVNVLTHVMMTYGARHAERHGERHGKCHYMFYIFIYFIYLIYLYI